ncbi:MAG: hypothetical protein GXX95_11710 [Methanomassiliicoccus sp.]|nr:hypothetical protein [Methanomassiliicoccus sp.]
MAGSIFLIQNNGILSKMEDTPYEKELDLQRLLAEYPDLLAGDQIDTNQPRRWLLISREMALPSEEDGPGRWLVDHLFVDQDAIPTIIETKRGSNTQIRREIVGQVLEYAANAILYWPVDVLKDNFQNRCRAEGQDPDQVLSQFLNGIFDNQDFWKRMESNLKSGKIRLLFVSDKIPETLTRIVEFMNQQMRDTEILAVEIRQFVSNDHKALVPRVLGQTEEAKAAKSSVSLPRQDERMFLNSLSEERKLFHEVILSLKDTDGFRLNWTARGYSLSYALGEKYVLILQGNLPYGNFNEGCYSTFWSIRDNVPSSADLIKKYSERLLATGLFEKTRSPFEVRCKPSITFDEEKGQELLQIFLDLTSSLRTIS